MTNSVEGPRLAEVVPLWPNGRSPLSLRPEDRDLAGTEDAFQAVQRALWSSGRLGLDIIEASQDCIEVIDPRGTLVFANGIALALRCGQSAAANTGATSTGMPWGTTWPREAGVPIMAALSVARSGTVARFTAWRPDADGEPICWDVVVSRMLDDLGSLVGFLAISRDVTGPRRMEESHELRRRELSHQLKNLFALVNGLITVSARSIPVVQPFARTLRDRFTALDRALDHLHRRSDGAQEPSSGTLQGILRALLTPYDSMGSAKRRFRFVDEGDAPVGALSATSLALVIHELATNAVKYGALSSEAGTIRVAFRRDGDALHLTWTERSGPAIERPPERIGFGSTLTQRCVTGQLGGTMTHAWEPEGLTVRITASLACLSQ